MQGDELLPMLGKVVSNSQCFELVTCLVLGKCLGFPAESDDRAAILVGQRLSTAARLDLASELVGVRDVGLESGQLKAWVTSARKANEQRNRVVHAAWHGDPTSGEFTGVITKRAGQEQWDKGAIQVAITAMFEAIEQGCSLLGREVIRPEP